MDKKKGIINVATSIVFRFLLIILNIIVRRFIISYIGNEINGLNSLYISILDVLSVAELGIGTAITFCMYKPIVEGDEKKVIALYKLFVKLYLIIGGIITVAGCVIMPALPYLAKDYQNANENLYLTFGLMLISVVISYLFSAKSSLINAYKNNYITTTINSLGIILQCVLQIIALIIFRSFIAFLVCRIIAILAQWLVTEIYTRKKYSNIITAKQKLDEESRKEVTKNIKAMFMHKIGGVLVNTADSIIISAFIGVAILGKYSNYTTIVTSMVSVLALCFSPLSSVIGHMLVESGDDTANRYFKFFYTVNFLIGTVFFLGYYAIIDNLVTILFGGNLELAKTISFVITLNYFIQFMEQAVRLFKDSSGNFYYDRWKCLFEGVLNVALSILFVLVFPEQYNVVGVIVATIITNLFICHVVEPYVLYKHGFKKKVRGYYIRNYLYILMFSAVLVALNFSMQSFENQWIELLVNGCIAIAISVVPCAIAILLNKDFGYYVKRLFATFKERGNKKVAESTSEFEASNNTNKKEELNMKNSEKELTAENVNAIIYQTDRQTDRQTGVK